MAYRVTLPQSLSNVYDVFHVSQLQKYIPDPSHVIQLDDVHVRNNLIVDASPLRIEDHEVKHLRGKKTSFGEGSVGTTCWWECDVRARESDERVLSEAFSLR